MDLIIIIPLSIAFIFSLTGFYFFYRIPLCYETNNILYPKISIIVPARNEEHNIGKLLSSINNQVFKIHEVIVVNDGSSDRTKQISLEYGANVIDNVPPENGWLGKPWACFQGANKAIGEILFFLDADTEFENGGLKKVIDTFLIDRVTMSVAPFHKVKLFYEEFSSIFNIVMLGSMNAFTPNNEQTDGLFGQSLIIEKELYNQIGGHARVKDIILENVYLANVLKSNGYKIKCFGGKNSLSLRMYPDGFINLINGWTKAFSSGADRTKSSTLMQIILWINAGFISTIMLVYQPNILTISFYLLFAIQFYWMLTRIGSFKIITALLFPFHVLFFSIVFARSVYYKKTGKKINWKQRSV